MIEPCGSLDDDLRPVVPYHGGKGRLAPWIVAHMPAHRVSLEPFAGSAAVLLAKARATHEVLNDVDGNVVTFYRVLRDTPDELEWACRLTPYARDEYAAADLHQPGLTDLERARRWWVRTCQSFAHTASTTTGWSVSTRRGSNDARTTAGRLARFMAVAERLAGVAIENRDALDLITAHADASTVIYADPPYLDLTRSMRCRPRGDYSHEFSSVEQHEALAAVLRATPAMVILSGYPSPLYDELYADWVQVHRRVLRRSSNHSHGLHRGHAVEVLWINQPGVTSQADLFEQAGNPLKPTTGDGFPSRSARKSSSGLGPERGWL